MNIEHDVKQIVEFVGGIDNVNILTHCMTRLRFRLKDRTKVEEDKLAGASGVLGLIDAGGQIQVVIGNAVSSYFEEAMKLYPMLQEGAAQKAVSTEGKMSFMDKVTDLASAIFIPSIGILAACGTLQGFLSLFTLLGVLDAASGTYLVLSTIGDSIFYFFPVFLAYTTAQKFGGKPFYSVIIAVVMIHPNIVGAVGGEESLSFLGIPLLLMNYSKSVFPVILSSYVACQVEKLARKLIPDILKMIFVPLCVFLIVIPLALLLIGPALTYAMSFVTSSVTMLYNLNPILAGVIVGGLWQFLVLFGISKAFVAIFAANFAMLGYCPFVAIVFFASTMGQVGGVLGFSLRSKNNKIKQVGFASALSGLFGVTEPALFGINVPARKPFLFGLLGGAAGGLVASLMGAKGYAFGAGILGIPVLIGPNGLDLAFYGAILGCIVAFAVSISLSYAFGWSKQVEDKLKV